MKKDIVFVVVVILIFGIASWAATEFNPIINRPKVYTLVPRSTTVSPSQTNTPLPSPIFKATQGHSWSQK